MYEIQKGDKFHQALDSFAHEIEDEDSGSIYPDYSGRAMYGSTCLGLVGHDILPLIIDLILHLQMAHEDDDDSCDLTEILQELRDGHTDGMGLDVIVYFPNITVSDEAVDALKNIGND